MHCVCSLLIILNKTCTERASFFPCRILIWLCLISIALSFSLRLFIFFYNIIFICAWTYQHCSFAVGFIRLIVPARTVELLATRVFYIKWENNLKDLSNWLLQFYSMAVSACREGCWWKILFYFSMDDAQCTKIWYCI